jgi:hypothetical protein
MFKKILKVLFLSDKRKGQRHINTNLQNVLFLLDGKIFSLSNLSEKGFGVHNHQGFPFSRQQIFEAELEFNMAERVHVKVKVARVKNHEIGFEILHSGKNFREQLSSLAK